jgi:hypothetical protein
MNEISLKTSGGKVLFAKTLPPNSLTISVLFIILRLLPARRLTDADYQQFTGLV